MKRIKFPLLLLGMLMSFSTICSQNVIPDSEKILEKLRLNKGIHGIQYETYETTFGDPFLYKDFHEGEIIFKNGEPFKLKLRYDIYADQVHLKDNDKIYGLIHPEALASIRIDTLIMIYCSFVSSLTDKSPEGGTYFILKTDGKCKLLVKKNIRVQEAEPPKILQDAKPAKFVHLSDTYYLKQDGKNAVRINGSKDLLTVMEDKKDEINRLIKSEKLGIKNEADLARIVTYYNSL